MQAKSGTVVLGHN